LAHLRQWRILAMLFRESLIFTRQIKALVDDDRYRQLQALLMARPDAGDLIPGSGGLRKVRMPMAGRGKRSGARVIYYWMKDRSRIYMLLAYAKNAQADLSHEELVFLRDLMCEEFD
jgi:hypothetical protein